MNTKIITMVMVVVMVFVFVAGCETRSGGEYDKTVSRPEVCRNMEVVNAGYVTAVGDSIKANYDWIVFKDESGNIFICRMNSEDSVWHITEVKN